jgi:hypothetical protein
MYEALRGSFGELRSMSAEPPTGLLASLQAIPANARRLDGVMTHVARNRKAYAGGAAAMVATGAVGLLLRSRSRRYAPA